MHLMDNLSRENHTDKCHFIEVDLDDDSSIRNSFAKTGARSIFLVTTTDFSYPTDTTFNWKSRSCKEAEDLEYKTICRVSFRSSYNFDNNISIFFSISHGSLFIIY